MDFLENEKKLERQLADVMAFHEAVTKMPIADFPQMLMDLRRTKALNFLYEEYTEFMDATSIADQADALIDLVYVAYGRLLEMGIRPGPAFSLVHQANMQKVSGANKRGDTFEAAKPEGWKAPDFEHHLGLDKGQYIGLARKPHPLDGVSVDECFARGVDPLTPLEIPAFEPVMYKPRVNPWDGASKPKPKILLLGYGRHGKDTVAEMLRDGYGFSFTSSSMACAEKVMLPHFRKARKDWFELPKMEGHKSDCPPAYDTIVNCFNDRHNHRAAWFKAIEAFNTPDKSALGQMIFSEHDIYCGLRSAREFHAVRNSGLYDVCIWVDRLQHVPAESRESCTVEPWMADYVLDNNGSLDELAFNLKQLMEGAQLA